MELCFVRYEKGLYTATKSEKKSGFAIQGCVVKVLDRYSSPNYPDSYRFSFNFILPALLRYPAAWHRNILICGIPPSR